MQGAKGRKLAGELIKARFVDVTKGQPSSCWLPVTQWLTESLPHPLPQEGASPYAGSRWQWLAQEHLLLFWKINANVCNYAHSCRIEWIEVFIMTVLYLLSRFLPNYTLLKLLAQNVNKWKYGCYVLVVV